MDKDVTVTCLPGIYEKERAMKRSRKLRWILLIAACFMLLTGAASVHAQTMKQTSGITWGLKTKKKYTYYSYWGGVGMIPQNFTVTKWKDRWAGYYSGSDRMRRLTFRITFIRKKKPTASQLIKASTYYNVEHPDLTSTSPRCYYTVVDFRDGISLEDPANPYKVRVYNSGWKQGAATTYRTKGYSISMCNTSVDVTIDYPASYKYMCIGIGGTTSPYATESEKLFWDGIYPFWMTDTLRAPWKKKIARFGRWWK